MKLLKLLSTKKLFILALWSNVVKQIVAKVAPPITVAAYIGDAPTLAENYFILSFGTKKVFNAGHGERAGKRDQTAEISRTLREETLLRKSSYG